MKAGDHNDVASYEAIEDAVWKPTQQGAAKVSVNNGKALRMLCYDAYEIVDRFQKLFAEPRSFSFIPKISSLDLSRSGGTSYD